MAITGKQRIAADYSKKVGFDEMNIVAINPTKEELESLLNFPDMKEPQYLGVFQDPDTGADFPKTTVSIWVQGKVAKTPSNIRYSIVKRERFNKDKTKKQFINEVGDTAWGADENWLKSMATDMTVKEGTRNFYKGFTSREFWPAYSGEDKLFEFLQKWTNLDTREQGNQITLDRTLLFKGNYSEIQDLLKTEFANNTVCAPYTVRVVPNTDTNATPGSFKEYQSVYDEVLPGSYIRYFQDGVTNRPDYVNKYIANLEGEYGSKDFYVIGPVKDYNQAENPAVQAMLKTAAVASGAVPATNTAAIGPDGSPIDDLPF